MAYIMDYQVKWTDGEGEHSLNFPTLEKATAAGQALVAYMPIIGAERQLTISERWHRFDRVETYTLGAIGIKNNGKRYNNIGKCEYAKNAYTVASNINNM